MVFLTKKQANEIVEYLKKEFPNEGCGILAGNEGEVKKIYNMVNIDKSSESFLMDSKEQLTVIKDIRNLGYRMLAIFHSHPETRAYPSEHDVRLAFYPDISYIIVSLKDINNPDIRSFKIEESKIIEEKIEIV